MAKGGYKGNSPARETSPEDYSGVWDITEQYGEQKTGSWPFQADNCAPKSLRFNESDSAYLSKTFLAAGNRKTWTWSAWFKKTRIDGTYWDWLFDTSTNSGLNINYDPGYADSQFSFYDHNGSVAIKFAGSFRDPGAWHSIQLVYDSSQATDTERVRVYVNGTRLEVETATWPSLNAESSYNNNIAHSLGRWSSGSARHLNGYLADVHFIDGQALEPTDFGFFDGQGIWQPKRFTGDYSSGPVYSNFLTSSGTFDSANPPPGAFDGIADNSNRARGGTDDILTFDISSFGFTGLFEFWSQNSNAEFSIDGGSTWSAISANSWTTASSDISGVTSIKFRPDSGATMKVSAFRSQGQWLIDPTVGRNSFHLDFSEGVIDESGLGNDWTANNIDAGTPRIETTRDINLSSQNRNFFFKGASGQSIGVSSGNHVWDSSDGLSWTYRGQSSTSVTLSSTYVMISGTTNIAFTNTNSDSVVYWDAALGYGLPNGSGSGSAETFDVESYGSDGADKFADSPVNGKEGSTGAGGERRGNYATLSPLTGAQTLSNGNLDVTGGNSWQRSVSTIAMSSGKYYWEYTITASTEHIIGVGPLDMQMSGNLGAGSPPGSGYGTELGQVNGTGANSSWNNTGQSSAGDVIGVAFDADAGNMYVYKNGTALNSGAASHTGLTNGPYYAVFSLNGNTRSGSVNFGQRPFKYQNAGTDRPSSDYKPLATSFLPEPTIKRGDEAMAVALYTGNGNSTQTIDGLKFSPDLTWQKIRNQAGDHGLTDIVRGVADGYLQSEGTDLPTGSSTNGVSEFTSDGFTAAGSFNTSSNNWATWAWDAGDATTTIAAGSLNSSAYDQSQTWSSGTVSGTLYSGSSWAKAFDGELPATLSTTNSAMSYSATGDITLTLPAAISGTIRVYASGASGSATGTDSKIVLSDGSEITCNVLSSAPQFFSFGAKTNITSITLKESTNGVRLAGVEVDGTLLVDQGVSVTNVPLVATDVRARTDAGFSIAKWSKSANNQSYAHKLSQAPEFIIAKSLDGAHSWRVWHKDLSNNKNCLLDTNQAEDTYTDMLGIPDFYKVPLINGGPGATNGGMIAYNFHSVEGYCQIGSFINPSSTEGAFVYCGFRPALIIGKCVKNISSSSGAGDWIIRDTSRSPHNNSSDGNTLVVNENAAEDNYYTAGQAALDILSNGFKIRHPNSSPLGDPGRLYIFAAWAEHPFASNARAR